MKRVLSVAVVPAGRVTAAHCLGGGGGLVFVPGTGTVTGATGVTVTGFGGGTSGSPWGDGDGQVVGVLGGHDRGGTTPGVSCSVVLGAQARRLYRRAAGHP
ncbi:hypothetical protein ACFQ7I_25040 [Streptomyces massasporeus]